MYYEAERETQALKAENAALKAQVADLQAKSLEAMKTENVCVLHDGGTTEGCAGCFCSVFDVAAQQKQTIADLCAALDPFADEHTICCDPETGNRLCEHERARAALAKARGEKP